MNGFFISTALLVAHLVAIAWIDFRRQVIPNLLNASLAVCGIAVSVVVLNASVPWMLFDVAVTVLVMLAIGHTYHSVRGRTGLGMGDVKFLGAAATWVGLAGMPWVVLVASVSGLLSVVAAGISGRDVRVDSRLAFGPHLSIGLLVAWLLRDVIGGWGS